MLNKFGKNSLKNRVGIDDRLIEISDLALKISPIDFGIPKDGGLRSAHRQLELVRDGKSKTLRSKHLEGRAIDFYAYVDGNGSWDTEHLAMVAASFLQAANKLGYKISWGGLWRSFKDYPHIQLEE